MAVTPPQKTMAISDWMLLLLLSIVWGGSFLFVGVAVKELPPLTIVALRLVLAATALQVLLRLLGTSFPKERSIWAAFLGMGLLNNAIPFTLIAWGQSHIPSGLASILNATTPLFTVIVAHVLTSDETMTGRRLAGVMIGFMGVAIMVGFDAVQALDADVAAQLAVIAAAVSYAFASVFGRRFRAMGISPMTSAAGQVTASSMVMVPMALFVERPWDLPVPSLGTGLSILGLALISTAFAYILFFRLLGRAGATNVGLVTFLIPISAILFGTLLLNEVLETRHFTGMALIGAGLLLIDGRVVAAAQRIVRAGWGTVFPRPGQP